MRQWNQIEDAAFIANPKQSADDFVQFFEREKLRDGEFADRNQELGLKQIDLVVHPGRAITDFVRRGNAIAAGRGFSRETATNGGKINFGADLFLADSAKFLEPAEERPARGPRERFSEDRFLYARCLTDEHDFAEDWSARNRRRHHPRTTPALAEARDVFFEQCFFARRARHYLSGGTTT
jgi:hypothetical protein